MDNAFNIIVIILSTFLGIFLLLGITIMVMVYKLVSSVRAVVARGEQLVDNAEELTETFRRNAGAVSLLKYLINHFIKK